ncbi:hypothetical protein NESM_000576900 [Novymonas esmeraldas]|uniref:Uncharacterized protein n=1 Tax=Novymonas esmeraldas TaxID=1808958 RepID=A0AAW0ESJ9_9TRYP
MREAALPHATALAQELEAELQHLDALQQRYTALLVEQLSSLDFLGTNEAAAPSAVAAAPCARKPSRPLPHRGGHADAVASGTPLVRFRRPSAAPCPRASAATVGRTPPPLPPPPPTRAHAGTAPPPATRSDEAAQRGRRALRLLREDRDAFFNAKARRAAQLLREGREAMHRRQARRLAAMAPTPPVTTTT